MVASDTVVGLVGAGILLVALVGVFVYESRQGGIEAPELEDAIYNASYSGTVTTTAGTGSPTQGVCQAPACVLPNTQVTLEVRNLTDAYGLKYVVFLTQGPTGSPYRAGELSKSGDRWTINHQSPVNNADKDTVTISVEKSATATAPGFVVLSFPKANTNGEKEVSFVGEAGNHTLSLTPSGNQLNVSAMIDDVPDKNGYEYHGWLKSETADGVTFTYVGKFLHPAGEDSHAMGKEDLVLAQNVNGTANSYNEFWVTLEGTGTMPGSQPGGPAVIKAEYNKYEDSGAEA